MFELQPWQWALALVGAVFVGLSKTGVPGVGVFAVALYANCFPARESTGILLPMLVGADIVAVAAYKRHAVWSHLWRLCPWVVTGVVIGYFTMDHVNNSQIKRIIGGIVVTMVLLHGWHQRQVKLAGGDADGFPHSMWFAAVTGILTGFTTMVANAAGPIMIIYMLTMGLPKMEFMGTGAWFFLILNVFKIPFSVQLGLITGSSLVFDLMMAPVVVASALAGRILVQRINQQWFATIALLMTLVAGLRLLFW
jgi:hypothetical protein